VRRPRCEARSCRAATRDAAARGRRCGGPGSVRIPYGGHVQTLSGFTASRYSVRVRSDRPDNPSASQSSTAAGPCSWPARGLPPLYRTQGLELQPHVLLGLAVYLPAHPRPVTGMPSDTAPTYRFFSASKWIESSPCPRRLVLTEAMTRADPVWLHIWLPHLVSFANLQQARASA
jgi:hypothetical protein